ncbi:MAG: hypothetical protein ACXABD_16370, partial [Candidatus Thorarchaeota archaeon]
ALHTHPTYVNPTDEYITDLIGAMVSGNTETGIAVTFQDIDNTIDFVLDVEITNFFAATDITGAQAETLTDGSDADALHTHGAFQTTEEVQDIVGAMVSGNTETLITVTYQDVDGTLDFVVDEASIDHGSLAGLGDDDHGAVYPGLAQVESITGAWTFDNVDVTIYEPDSAAAGQLTTAIIFRAKDSIGAQQNYAWIRGEIEDPTNGAEAGNLYFGGAGGNGAERKFATLEQNILWLYGQGTTKQWIRTTTLTAGAVDLELRATGNLIFTADGGDATFSFGLSGNWDAGAVDIRAQTLTADVTTGTAPLNITSTTVVTNLNADLLDGQHASEFAPIAEGWTTEELQDLVGAMTTGNTETGIAVTYEDVDGTIDFIVDTEWVQDLIGAMVTGNTETLITVTYQDTDGTLDFVVALAQNDLSDTVITGPIADNEVLAYTTATAKWVNQTAAEAGLSAVGHTHASTDITDWGEAVADIVGAMVTGNTETLIAVTYDDADNTLDFVVNEAGFDHGSIGGLGDDDHPQYAAIAQDEDITGAWEVYNDFVLRESGASGDFHEIAQRLIFVQGDHTGTPKNYAQIAGYVIESGLGGTLESTMRFYVIYGSEYLAADIKVDTFRLYAPAAETQYITTGTLTAGSPNLEINPLGNLIIDPGSGVADFQFTLLADWDTGDVEIRAQTFESDVVTGTAPFTIASTTVVTNLNADLLDGNHAAAFALASHTHPSTDITDWAEAVSDTVGAMVSGNTETLITVTYQDADNTLDFVVNEAGIDHGALAGLGDDDHTQYAALAQNESIAGQWAFTDYITMSDEKQIFFGTQGYLQHSDTGNYLELQYNGDLLFKVADRISLIVQYTDIKANSNFKMIWGYDIQLYTDDATTLTASWDAATGDLTANVLESTETTGTAPLIIASTTKVTNLNADLLDDQTGSYYLDSANFTGTDWTDLTDAGATTLHKHDHGGMDGLGDDDHTQYLLTSGARNVTGAMIFESGVTINALANDADTRMEGDTIDDVFFLNAGDNSIIIGGRDIAVDEGYSFGIQSKTGPDFTDVANFAGMMLGDVEGGGRVLNLSYLDYDTGVYQADFSIFSTNLYFNPDTGAWVDLDATRYGVYYGQSSRAATDSGHYFYLTPAVSSTTLTELFSMTWANGIVLNETGADLNLRAESDNNANMFVLDAGADFIGIGTATQGGDAILSIDDPTTWGGSVTSFTGVDIGHNTNGTQMRLAVLDHASVDGVIAQIAANARWEPSTAAWAQSSSGDASVVMEFLTGEADPHFRIFTFDAASTTARYHLRVGFNETVVNDSGLDTDFRVESDDDSHSMFLNANDNQWFFGYNAAPTTFATAPNIATFGDGTASIGIAIHSGTAHLGTLAFADGTTSTAQYRGYVEYDHNTDIMT